MDWIEKAFHVSPDGGSGTVEFVISLIVFTVVALAIGRALRAVGRRRSSRGSSTPRP